MLNENKNYRINMKFDKDSNKKINIKFLNLEDFNIFKTNNYIIMLES